MIVDFGLAIGGAYLGTSQWRIWSIGAVPKACALIGGRHCSGKLDRKAGKAKDIGCRDASLAQR